MLQAAAIWFAMSCSSSPATWTSTGVQNAAAAYGGLAAADVHVADPVEVAEFRQHGLDSFSSVAEVDRLVAGGSEHQLFSPSIAFRVGSSGGRL